MKSMQTKLIHVSLALVLTATPLWPTVAASQNVWTIYGPDGGTVTALAIDPQTPTTLYAGITDSRVFAALGDLPPGGLLKTTDGGNTWRASGPGLPNIRINGIYVDPHAPTTIYLSMYGGRIFKSIDGGGSWHGTSAAVGGPYPAIPIAGIVFDPQTPGTAYAAGGGGVVKSVDGGNTWRTIITGFPASAGVRSIAIDPKIPTTLYAGLVPNSASQARGVFKSTDGGATWRSTSLTDAAVVVLVIDPQTPTTLYAGTDKSYVFKSTDGGDTWRAVREGLSIESVYSLAIDPGRPMTLYSGFAGTWEVHVAPSGRGVFKSTDGGATWRALDTDPANSIVTALVIDPLLPSTIYMGTEVTGIFKSTDGGDRWHAINTGLPSLGILPVAIDPQKPSIVYGWAAGVFKSTDGGGTWRAVNTGLPTIIITNLVVDSKTPTTLYVGTYGAGVFKSTDGAASWHDVPIPGPAQPGVTRQPIWYITVLTLDPQTPTTVYAGGESSFDHGVSTSYVFKSTDGGESWRSFKINDTGVTLRKVRIDPQSPSTLYAVNIQAGIFKSTDGGENWRPVINGLPLEEKCYLPTPCLYIHDLVIDPRTPTTLYAAQSAGVFKSTDGGANWSSIIAGLTNLKVFALAIDPKTPTTIYAGTNGGGVFKSTNGGGTWAPLNSGLINLSVGRLVIDPLNPSTLYAGTGSGVFVLRQ